MTILSDMDNSIAQITITSTLSPADQQAMRRAVNRFAERNEREVSYRNSRILVFDALDNRDLHQIAHKVMLNAGRVFQYSVD